MTPAKMVFAVRAATVGWRYDRVSIGYPGAVVHGRLIIAADSTIDWSANDWASTNKADATQISALNVWFADLPTEDCPDGSVIEFTFFWKEAQRWEGRNYSVAISGTK